MRLPRVSLLLTAATAVGAQVVGIQTGINVSTGERPARRNINDLYAEGGPAWDLYIQGLISLQSVNQSDWSSYYQIMGIHGLPFTGYNGVEQVPGGARIGFCPHGQINFGTWHRPYVALYEQVLAQHVQRAASNYTGTQGPAYKVAAANFRIGYWDWAHEATFPPVTMLPTLTINTAAGPATVRNPLYAYGFQTFPFTDPDFGGHGQLTRYPQTKRCANRRGEQDWTKANSLLSGSADWFRDAVYDVFTQAQSFEEMTTSSNSGPSFEDPHNSVHNEVACFGVNNRYGHMSQLAWSAFDPIFMLHHTNVDRLIAMWQAIHYNDSMFTSTANGFALYGVPYGPVTPDSPLKPFKDASGNFYTSKTVEQIKTFGYTYPEIRDWAYTRDQLSGAVIQEVNLLYGSGSAASTGKTKRWQYSRFARGALEQRSNDAKGSPQPVSKDYAVEIKVEREELPLPCSIDVFLGDTRVGTTAILGMPEKGCFHSSIPLRRQLQRKNVKLDQSTNVVDMLQQGLRVEIYKDDGSKVPVESVPSLQADIKARDFVPRRNNSELPKFGEVQRHSVKITTPKGYGGRPRSD